MAITIDTVVSKAMQLPKDQRLTLAHRLLSSIESAVDLEVEVAWDSEIRERIHRYDIGQSTTIPATQIFKELDQRFHR